MTRNESSVRKNILYCMSVFAISYLFVPSRGDESGSGLHDTPADQFIWDVERRGWQVGARLLSATGRLHPGDPAVFQFVLKNATDQPQTVVIQQYQDISPTLGQGNRISLNISGSSQQKHQHVIGAGEVLESRQYRVVLSTDGLPAGDYHVSRAVPFWVPDKEHANRSSGLDIRTPISFTIEDPADPKLSKIPSADNDETQIHWGQPVAGLVVGMRLPDGNPNRKFDDVLVGEVFVRNLSTKTIEFEYDLPDHSNWNTHVETKDGDYVRLNMVMNTGYLPRNTKRLALRPFEQAQIFGVKNDELASGPQIQIAESDKNLRADVSRHLITNGGDYRWFAHVTIHQIAVKDFTMIIGSSGVPFSVAAEEK